MCQSCDCKDLPVSPQPAMRLYSGNFSAADVLALAQMEYGVPQEGRADILSIALSVRATRWMRTNKARAFRPTHPLRMPPAKQDRLSRLFHE